MAEPVILRHYQARAVDAIAAAARARDHAVIAQCATAGGKTPLAAAVAVRAVAKGNRVLFLAHRTELRRQGRDKLVAMGLPAASIAMLGERGADHAAPVKILSIQSAGRLALLPEAEVVIVDECHRAVGPTYKRVLGHYDRAFILGLTATPDRLDGRPMRQVFQRIILVANPSELVAQGYLVEPTVWTVPPEQLPELVDVGHHGGDFDRRALAVAVRKRHLVGSIVEHWLRRAEGRRTLVFASSREHSREIAEAFVAAGVRAVHVDGKTRAVLRKRALEQLAAGEIDVLCSCDIFIEGLDVPSVKCIVLARPTESVTIYLQSVGRALRPWEGITALVLDHAGNARRHGLPTDDRVYSLDGRRKGPSLEVDNFATRTCPACFLVTRGSARVCPACGHVFVADPARTVRTVAGNLVELTREAITARREAWAAIWARAYREGYQPSWVDHAYRARFAENAPPYFTPPARPPSTPAERQQGLAALVGRARREGHDDTWVVERYVNRFGEGPPGWQPRRRVG